ncbi:glycosyltransferase [Planctomicrobium sp. SH527]|uniref:glycosyltransferase n=1 Tax=Planctomicrobium sp. SH527 TaxID=3448123 RepID=UPI003F5C9C26
MTIESANPMRIAFCITDLDPGGAEKALFQIVTHLDRSQWASPVVYCIGPEAELAAKLRQQGIETHCYGARSSKSLGVFPWLIKELRAFRPDVLQCFLFHANMVGRIAGRMAGVPVIVAGHRVAEREKRWHLWGERLTRGLVDQHICVSQGVADHLRVEAKIPHEKLHVVPNGITIPSRSENPFRLRQALGVSEAAPVVMGVGRLHPQKGFQLLIDEFVEIRNRVPTAHLVLVGEGPQRSQLEKHIRDCGLEGFAHLLGYRSDVPELMRQADVLVVSSQWEGMPNVVLEAFAVGLPVVSTPTEGIDELKRIMGDRLVVTPSRTGGFAEPACAVLLSERKFLTEAELLKLISEKHLTWDSVAEVYSRLYFKFLKEQRFGSECRSTRDWVPNSDKK